MRWTFINLKKKCYFIKLDNPNDTKIDTLLSLMDNLDTAFDKDQTEKMNRKLNLLTIWSTIFLPLSFYTGMWGMNFDDVPLLTGDHGILGIFRFNNINYCWDVLLF